MVGETISKWEKSFQIYKWIQEGIWDISKQPYIHYQKHLKRLTPN